MVDSAVECVRRLADEQGVRAPRLVFTTHSIPTATADTAGPSGGAYVAQHEAVAALVAGGVAARAEVQDGWDLVYQSRSGAPHVPWLEPDISDHLAALKEQGVPGVVIVPIGFVSDHMEVVWDLDTVALGHAAEIGLPARRAATVGTDPRFVAMVRELVLERVGREIPRALSPLGPSHDVCPAHCCPNPRGPRPALCQRDADVTPAETAER
jgi:ferrochelatase